MSIFRRKKQTDAETESLKSFLDMIAPSIVKFETGYYICGNTFRCIWALREYPTSTDDRAILRHLGEKHGVTLHIYTRMVSPLEERKIVHNAEIRNRMKDMTVVVTAKGGGAGRLFGSVTNTEVADALAKQADIKLDKRKIVLDEPIKAVGVYTVKCKLGYEINADLKVEVKEG